MFSVVPKLLDWFHRKQPRTTGAASNQGDTAPAAESGDRAEITAFEQRGEQAYTAMYDAIGRSAAGHYNDAKYYFAQAIGLAEHAGLHDEAGRPRARLDHIVQVYRHQFP